MNSEALNDPTRVTAPPAGGGRGTWWAWCIWLPGCVAFAALVAWAVSELSRSFSPLGVLPLAVGLVLGASLVALMRLFQMGHRPTAWLAVGLSVAVVVVGQHWLGYRAAVVEADRRSEEFQKTQAKFGELVRGSLPPRPASLVDYLRGEAQRGRPLSTVFGQYSAKGALAWITWTVDALLVLAPAVVMMGFALRRPFCRKCGSWYATRRSGSLDAQAARRLAAALELPLEDSAGAARYRLICCNQGCAPSGFSLSWEGNSSGACKRAPYPLGSEIVWLDDQQRTRIVAILDESRNSLTPDS